MDEEHTDISDDANQRELEEAPNGPLKIVMDARDLEFLDGAFGAVTAFFMLMYVDQADFLGRGGDRIRGSLAREAIGRPSLR